MISPTKDQHTLLQQVVAAGSQGLRFTAPEAAERMGDLMALALDDLVDVTEDRRVVATQKGRAFYTRTAA